MNGDGSLGRTRTADPVINSHLLYQLSYQGIGALCIMVACLKCKLEVRGTEQGQNAKYPLNPLIFREHFS